MTYERSLSRHFKHVGLGMLRQCRAYQRHGEMTRLGTESWCLHLGSLWFSHSGTALRPSALTGAFPARKAGCGTYQTHTHFLPRCLFMQMLECLFCFLTYCALAELMPCYRNQGDFAQKQFYPSIIIIIMILRQGLL